jgi:hypothetical protein
MIVKVQVSLTTPPTLLVYDKRRKVEWTGPLTPEVAKLLAGRPKAFFLAVINPDRTIGLEQEATWQTW